MIKNRFSLFLVAAVACSPVLAENPSSEKPLTESELLRQIEAIKPLEAVKPTAAATPAAAAGNALFNQGPTAGDIIKLPGDKVTADNAPEPVKAGSKRSKDVTEITAIEATFDQKNSIAVFVNSVVVKNPQFNIECDKLTAYLKHDKDATPEKEATGTPKPGATPTAKAATPKAGATPAGKGDAAKGDAPKKKGGGLDKAVAITTSERRVHITQDKVEADGSVTHGVGLADRAEYYSDSGDIFLYGSPDVTQGMNRCVATSPETWMKLNRDGRMEAHGPHRTFIVDTSDREKQTNNATKPGASTR